MTDLSSLAKTLLSSSSVLILCHEHPDGDTLGSAAALYAALRLKGISAHFSAGEEITKKYAFLMNSDYVLSPKREDYDCVAAVDIAETGMLGNNVSFAGDIDILIDHHRTNVGYGKQNLIDPAAAATGELIFLLIREMGVALTPAICLALYTALSTDTGCFRFTNTTERTLSQAAEIYATGFRPGSLTYTLFEEKSKARVLLEREMIDRMSYAADGHLVAACLPLALRERLSASEDDIDGISGLMRSVEGVWAAALLKEKEPGVWKASLRSGENMDVSAVCQALGGGGHARAAGCTLVGEEKAVLAQILSALEGALPSAE